MPKIDPAAVPKTQGSSYPRPFDEPCRARHTARLSRASDITQFGVNLVTLEPGAWSSQRHWHSREDEFVYVLEGEVVLVEEDGETLLRAGDAAAWKAGAEDGHHLQNRSSANARFLAIGSRDDDDRGEYPDIDLRAAAKRYSQGGTFTHKDGTPYPKT